MATGSVIDSGHPYLTRMIVRRPADPKRFNGTVLVEWLNVTNGFDADNLWFFDWEHVLREGYAWVGVSAQNVGVARLVSWNPTRYAGFRRNPGRYNQGRRLYPTISTRRRRKRSAIRWASTRWAASSRG